MKAKSTVDAPRSRRQSIDTSTPNMNGTSAIGAPRMNGKSFGLSREGKKGGKNLRSTWFSRDNFGY